jgi:hypothetical protein
MHITFEQSFALISTAGVAWLMIRAGTAKKMLVVRTPSRCASCGRRRTRRGCPCSTPQ